MAVAVCEIQCMSSVFHTLPDNGFHFHVNSLLWTLVFHTKVRTCAVLPVRAPLFIYFLNWRNYFGRAFFVPQAALSPTPQDKTKCTLQRLASSCCVLCPFQALFKLGQLLSNICVPATLENIMQRNIYLTYLALTYPKQKRTSCSGTSISHISRGSEHHAA